MKKEKMEELIAKIAELVYENQLDELSEKECLKQIQTLVCDKIF